MTDHTFGPLAVVGGGNMAQAIVRGGLDAGVLRAEGLIVCEPDSAKREFFEALGIRTTTDHGQAVKSRWPMLLAVKPQSFTELASQLAPHIGDGPYLAISILAGTPSARVHRALGVQGRVVRVMPNTPVTIRCGASAIAPGPSATAEDMSRTQRLFDSVGVTFRIDESLMNSATALIGSGPAYLFYLAEAMIRAGTEIGFDAATASAMTRATLDGASRLLAESGNATPEQLRQSVTSKGGTTAAATDVLDSSGLLGTIRRAIVAARDRGDVLAQIAESPGT